MNNFFEDGRLHDGLTYEEYLAQWQRGIERPLQELDKAQRKRLYYARYNQERSQRVQQAYRPSERLQQALAGIEGPQLWMVLTEDWCVDSAYSLPVITAAALQGPVQLRILPRDANLDVMDQYLTGQSRSIPKLVGFEADGEECFRWGPRPAELARLREELKAADASGQQITTAVIEWYEKEGWLRVDEELAALLEAVAQPG